MNKFSTVVKFINKKDLLDFNIVTENTPTRKAIIALEKSSVKIILVVDQNLSFLGTVTDGDIRRGLINNFNIDEEIAKIVHHNPIKVTNEISHHKVREIMDIEGLDYIPCIDQNNKVLGLFLRSNEAVSKHFLNRIVLMAGGKGIRLRPYTEKCPKPLLKIAGKPILEYIISNARDEGFVNFTISVNYLGHLIKEHFLNGESLKVNINYINEKNPLGTAGALSLINEKIEQDIIVINGDVMSNVSLQSVLLFHKKNKADATMVTRQFEQVNPYGVVHTKNIRITHFEEKPIVKSNINAGIYVLKPFVIKELIKNEPITMPEILEKLIAKNKKVIAFPLHEEWMDIGIPSDLEKIIAQKN